MNRGPVRRISDRTQWVTIGITAAMLAVFFLAVYMPETDALQQARAELDRTGADLKAMRAQAEQLPLLEEKVAARTDDYARNCRRVPASPTVPEFLKAVADILKSENVGQRELAPKRAQAKEGYVELPLTIHFEAPFATAYRVMGRLQRLHRINHVRSLEMSSPPDAGGRVRVKMEIVIYHGAPKDVETSSEAAERDEEVRA